MKVTTTNRLKYLSAFMLIVFLSNCKKDSQPKLGPAPVSVNPNTAHANANYAFDDNTLINAGWTEAFVDNFDGDLSNWTVSTGGSSDGGLEYDRAENVQIVNGNLQISSKKETVNASATDGGTTATYNFTSGGLLSKYTVSAKLATPKVRIIARIKAASGIGMTSQFRSYGNYYPTQGEIDYMQVVADNTHYYLTNYFIGSVLNQNVATNSIMFNPTDADLTADYHVYMMEWTQDALTSYIDGQLAETKTGDHVTDLFNKNENISLSLVIGGYFYDNLDPNKIQTGTMYVDYVKVFTSK